VRLAEAVPLAGALRFELLSGRKQDGGNRPRAQRHRREDRRPAQRHRGQRRTLMGREPIQFAVRSPRPLLQAMRRGFRGRCPNCGEVRLFGAFLKVVDRCRSAERSFSTTAPTMRRPIS